MAIPSSDDFSINRHNTSAIARSLSIRTSLRNVSYARVLSAPFGQSVVSGSHVFYSTNGEVCANSLADPYDVRVLKPLSSSDVCLAYCRPYVYIASEAELAIVHPSQPDRAAERLLTDHRLKPTNVLSCTLETAERHIVAFALRDHVLLLARLSLRAQPRNFQPHFYAIRTLIGADVIGMIARSERFIALGSNGHLASFPIPDSTASPSPVSLGSIIPDSEVVAVSPPCSAGPMLYTEVVVSKAGRLLHGIAGYNLDVEAPATLIELPSQQFTTIPDGRFASGPVLLDNGRTLVVSELDESAIWRVAVPTGTVERFAYTWESQSVRINHTRSVGAGEFLLSFAHTGAAAGLHNQRHLMRLDSHGTIDEVLALRTDVDLKLVGRPVLAPSYLAATFESNVLIVRTGSGSVA